MLYVWILLILALFYCDRLRRLNVDNKTLKCRYKLYALRDSLRYRVITGEIKSNYWVFEYLDSSITKTISKLDDVTAWHGVFLYLAHRKDPDFDRAKTYLDRELEKPENRSLRRVHRRYCGVLSKYLMRRHPVSLRLFFSQWITYIFVTQFLRQQLERLKMAWARAVEMFTEAPETSTLYEFGS